MEGPAHAVLSHFYGLLMTLIQNQEELKREERSTQAAILQLGHKVDQVETKVDQLDAKLDDLMELQVMIF